MRKQLCDALIKRSANSSMVFLTGDLGFMALEPLQHAMGSRFINAGVSEQNMVSVVHLSGIFWSSFVLERQDICSAGWVGFIDYVVSG